MNRTLLVFLAIFIVSYVLFGGSSTSGARAKKVTVEVMTPEGPAQGASVIETRNFKVPWWYPVGGNRAGGTSQRGEAAYVDLGSGRYLFVALDDHLRGRPIKRLFSPDDLMPDGSFKPGSEPLLVTFSDINDPNSVRKVDPDNFAAAFGSGFELQRLSVSDTDEEVSRGTLARKFPALWRGYQRPPAERVRQSSSPDYDKSDLRLLGWYAFEAADWS